MCAHVYIYCKNCEQSKQLSIHPAYTVNTYTDTTVMRAIGSAEIYCASRGWNVIRLVY